MMNLENVFLSFLMPFRNNQSLSTHGTESCRWIDDRLLALGAFFNQLLSAYCAKELSWGEVNEVCARRAELVTFFDDETFNRFLFA